MRFKIKFIMLLFAFNSVSELYATNNEILETLPKYSQRGDNYIDLKALLHEENVSFRVENEDKVKIFFKARNNDVYSIELIYGNEKKMMQSIGNYNGTEIFMTEVPNKDFQYYFEIIDKKQKYYYGKQIETERDKVQKFLYRQDYGLTNIPEWSKGKVGYQIYIDSFRNGNVDNDPIFNEYGPDDFSAPKGETLTGTEKKNLVSAYWGSDDREQFTVSEWNGNYEAKSNWEKNSNSEMLNYSRYYGGDLQGIKEKLDYLKDLGVNYIILSSPFYSFTNHKYDTIDFHHIDPFFGNMEQTGTTKGLEIKGKIHNVSGDKELNLLVFNPQTKRNLLDENMKDEKTWVWTDSDLELASLVNEAHAKGIKVVVEVALDTTSVRFFANIDVESKDWYLDQKNNVLNLNNSEVKEYVQNSMKKWILGPDGVVSKDKAKDDGIDGIRFVYYNENNKKPISEITKNLKNLGKDLLITGEFSLKLLEDIKSGVYDSGSDYNIVNNLIKYTINDNENYKINSVEFASKLVEMYEKYNKNKFASSQIFVDSLDTDRIYSSVINKNRVFDRNNQSNQGYLDIRPDLYDENAVNKLKRIIGVQLLLPASPVIYYGDEKGMWGSDSPRNRKPMLWDDYMPYENETDDINKYVSKLSSLPTTVQINEVAKTISYPVVENKEIEDYYRALLKIRNEYSELFRNGEFRILEVYGDLKTKKRVDNDISNYLEDEKRKAKIYRNQEISIPKPNIDFITYEIKNKKESIIVIVNNSSDSYPLNLQVPKLFGFYANKLVSDEVYAITDKKISTIVRPYEVKVLYSNDTNIFDAFKK